MKQTVVDVKIRYKALATEISIKKYGKSLENMFPTA